MPKFIYTNERDVVAEYTMLVSDPTEFDRKFAELLSWKLSALIAPSLIAGDPYKLGINAAKRYEDLLTINAAKSMNEVEEYAQPDSEFISVRL